MKTSIVRIGEMENVSDTYQTTTTKCIPVSLDMLFSRSNAASYSSHTS